jgi:hypothetical protein
MGGRRSSRVQWTNGNSTAWPRQTSKLTPSGCCTRPWRTRFLPSLPRIMSVTRDLNMLDEPGLPLRRFISTQQSSACLTWICWVKPEHWQLLHSGLGEFISSLHVNPGSYPANVAVDGPSNIHALLACMEGPVTADEDCLGLMRLPADDVKRAKTTFFYFSSFFNF